MDLQISVFLLFILFTAGHSLDCYQCSSLTGSCAGQTAKTCPIGSTQCLSATGTDMVQVGGISSTIKYKDCAGAAADDCKNFSYNFGIERLTYSCCNTNLCNAQDTDPVLTGKKCYYCDDKGCSNTVDCSGTEDRCIEATGTFRNQSVVKGCISKSTCVTSNFQGNFTCCEGNLCNGAQSVTQSFLFLCCSLLSYFMMH